jgi:phosphoribosylformylglycinamidine cyclo-ligase
MEKKTSYKDAGVDIDKGNLFVERIRPLIRATFRKEVRGDIGKFAGLFHLDTAKYKSPLLVSSTDGVGTKLKIAQMMDKHDTVGIDLVAMSVNDIVVNGAEPLFFLDYIACGSLSLDTSVSIVEGITKGCTDAGCALLGGETAEMPGFYAPGEYDLAGFAVGIVDSQKLIDGSTVSVGDCLIGLASNGIHSNGYSLVRKVLFDQAKLDPKNFVDDLNDILGIELLRPTRIYVRSVLNVCRDFTVKGIVHITGGGFIDNIPRVLPDPCGVSIRKGSWDIPPVFDYLQRIGSIEEMEMYRVFNMGIGMVLIVPEKQREDILHRLEALGEQASVIGSVVKREEGRPAVVFGTEPE